MNKHTYMMDGDNLRMNLNCDLSFNDEGRHENIRRAMHVAKILYESGLIVIASFISPFRDDRDKIRGNFNSGDFIEVFVDTPIEICMQRDPKGLYKKARENRIANFTGITSRYEKPNNPELHIVSDDIQDNTDKVIQYLTEHGYIR